MAMELYNALRQAGVDADLAHAAAAAVLGTEDQAMLATKTDLAELRAATKADIADLRAATKADIADLRADFAELRAETKADISELRCVTRADIAELKADLTKWNAGLLVAMTAIFAGIVKLL